ncbi:hypothetical protein NL108_009655 [Boleophthalmus pectinirostris]|nr:hypothetical protein NL108_009655 [Boleophthalmus pectinirostris]
MCVFFLSSARRKMFTNQSEPECSVHVVSLLIAWVCVYTLFVPFFFFVLFVGFQQFRSKTSTMSNSDVFTMNITIMEILNIVGANIYSVYFFSKNLHAVLMGQVVALVATTGQTVFHNLTCVDRYLAVVQPITYLNLKKSGGVKVRNISIGCTWVMSIALVMVAYFTRSIEFQVICFVLQPIGSIPVVCFCTASVLCVLIRPRPGEVGGDRRALNQSKRKAFNTMMVTLGALLSRFIVLFLSYIIALSPGFTEITCIFSLCACLCALPSSLMLPLLFLNRAGKLPKWK